MEKWREIPQYEGFYEVSNKGRVRSLDRMVKVRAGGLRKHHGRVLKPGIGKPGYPICALVKHGKQISKNIHQLVMLAFVGPPPKGKEINHIDGDKTNNNLENLEYVTSRQNSRHAVRVGLFDPRTQVGEDSINAKLTREDVYRIRREFKKTKTGYQLADELGVHHGTIRSIYHKRSWKHI